MRRHVDRRGVCARHSKAHSSANTQGQRGLQGALNGFIVVSQEVRHHGTQYRPIDEAVLALLSLGLHDDVRAWKSFDWEAMNRLHEKGFITDPVGKAKSVVVTEDGLREAERLVQKLFGESER